MTTWELIGHLWDLPRDTEVVLRLFDKNGTMSNARAEVHDAYLDRVTKEVVIYGQE